MISCPNCGGNVKFDIPSQQLSCEYCHEYFDPYSFESKTSDAEETRSFERDYEVTIFTCPQCGGEILSTDNAAAGFCSFCGASTILYSRISHKRRPDFIIPFQKSKEDCKQAYASLMKRAIFAPKELKDPKYIDSFRGIYMPYWAFYITQKGPLKMVGTREYRKGDYLYKDVYHLEGDLDAYYKGLSYDASSSFADNISEALAPYDLKGMKAFTPAYLSGFYADTADVASAIYQSDAEYTAYSQTISELHKVPQFSTFAISTPSTPANIHSKMAGVDRTMFPVWFMSYRKNDRIAYVTVNGQSGKVVADVPVDPKKYVLGSLLLAIPLFIVFALTLTLLPPVLLTISGALALFAAILYTAELGKIVRKDSNADDRGKFYKDAASTHVGQKSKSSFKKQKKTAFDKSGKLTLIVILIAVCASILPAIAGAVKSASFFVWLAIVTGMIITVAIGAQKMSSYPGKTSLLGYIAASAAIGVGFVITLIHPVSDLYYYGGTIFGLAAVALSIGDIIKYYNVLSTRRLPQFDKQGGDDRA